MAGSFHVGFWGSGEVSADAATDLLDAKLLPADPDTDFHIYLPDEISKGMRSVQSAMACFSIDCIQVDLNTMLGKLSDARSDGEPACLVVLGEDEQAIKGASRRGLPVRDLCAGLTDVELPEPEPAPRRRGRPRREEPATEPAVTRPVVTEAGVKEPAATDAMSPWGVLLDTAVRQIVREELARRGL